MKKITKEFLLSMFLLISMTLFWSMDCSAEDISTNLKVGTTITKHASLSSFSSSYVNSIHFTGFPKNDMCSVKFKVIVDINNIKSSDDYLSIYIYTLSDSDTDKNYYTGNGNSIHYEKTFNTYADLLDDLTIQAVWGNASFDYTVKTIDYTKYVTSLSMYSKRSFSLDDDPLLLEELIKEDNIQPEGASLDTVDLSSSNTKVASVSDGDIELNKAGKTTITATLHNGKKYTCVLTVKKPGPYLDYSSYKLEYGTSFKNTLNYATKKVTWSSSNKKIATVSSKGKVTAKKAGTCYIKAKSNGKTYKCKVKVYRQKPNFYAVLDGYYTRNNYFVVRFKNLGKGKLTIYSAKAHSMEVNYKSYDRKLYLPKNKNIVIKPGKSKKVRFYVKGYTTWPDVSYHTLRYYFSYSGKKYLGSTWDEDSKYQKGKKWKRTYTDRDSYEYWY